MLRDEMSLEQETEVSRHELAETIDAEARQDDLIARLGEEGVKGLNSFLDSREASAGFLNNFDFPDLNPRQMKAMAQANGSAHDRVDATMGNEELDLFIALHFCSLRNEGRRRRHREPYTVWQLECNGSTTYEAAVNEQIAVRGAWETRRWPKLPGDIRVTKWTGDVTPDAIVERQAAAA